MKIGSNITEPPPLKNNSVIPEKRKTFSEKVGERSINYIPLGQAGNTYSTALNSRTYLWANSDLNSVVFTHRMTGGGEYTNSRISYDVSIDGGLYFETNQQVYNPMCGNPGSYDYYPARYPQGGIINPVGNTNPDNAYFTYLGSITGGYVGNGHWGAYSYGVNQLTQTNPPQPTQGFLLSEDDQCKYIADAFTIAQDGKVWLVDGNYCYNGNTGDYNYNGKLTIGKGEIISDSLIYTETMLNFLTISDTINDHKIAFAPDGQIGYILIMALSVSDPQPYTNYHPILLKTTDGGTTWSNPIHVSLGGGSGIFSLKYYWSDELIESLPSYGYGFNRNEVYYNMSYQAGIAVDKYGNPHITGIIGVANDSTWYPYEGYMATWHIYSNDGGTSWNGAPLYDNCTMENDFGTSIPSIEYNRPYAASSMDGETLLFSWIDTNIEDSIWNSNPDIFCIAYSPVCNVYSHGGVENITELSQFWHKAYLGCMAQNFITEQHHWTGQYKAPFVLMEYTVPGDPYSPVNYWYIDGYTFTHPCYTDIEENKLKSNFSVTQNSPNPTCDNTNIIVTTHNFALINLIVYNNLGQIMFNESINSRTLSRSININVSGYNPGIYHYTVEVNGERLTKKMVVK